jgi:hypothetical protein
MAGTVTIAPGVDLTAPLWLEEADATARDDGDDGKAR